MNTKARNRAYFQRRKKDKLLFKEFYSALQPKKRCNFPIEPLLHYSISTPTAPAHLYVLEGQTPKPVYDVIEWAKYYETADRIVKQTMIKGISISTVFLGMDYGVLGIQPLLSETMVSGGAQDFYQKRYSTWEEAVEGHQQVCELVIESL